MPSQKISIDRNDLYMLIGFTQELTEKFISLNTVVMKILDEENINLKRSLGDIPNSSIGDYNDGIL